LWEFAHFGSSGELPRREAATGRISLGAETGLVLVLIPGGRYLQGAQREDARAPNYDPLAQPQDGPPREVELAPFFLSKFELTRGQWLRVMGTEPSPIWTQGGEPAGPRHPLEFVSWDEARAALLRLDLELPTEAQWEYAARGGKATVWWTGNEPGSLLGAENLWGRHSEWEKFPADLAQDPWLRTSPVGSLRPNPYGLHDVLGNVKEWCLDDYFGRYFDRPLRPGDGLVQGTGDAHRSLRGGNHAAGVEEARVALHTDNLRGYRSRAIGLRPARDLRRSSP
jgi:formylglycine-generating enzyme required for sulfatase activity